MSDDRLPTTSRRRHVRAVIGVVALGVAVPSAALSAGAITRQAESVRMLEVEIAGLDARFGQAAAAYDGARSRLDAIQDRVSRNTVALKRARVEFARAQGLLAFRLSAVYRQPQPSGLEMLLRSGSLSEAVSRVDVLDRVQRQDAHIVTSIAAARERMRTVRTALLADRQAATRESNEASARLTEVRSIRGARRAVLIAARGRLAVMIAAEADRRRRAALVAARQRVVRAGSSGPSRSRTPPTGGLGAGDALRRIALCESGGNPSAVSPSGLYRGKYQFDPQTWQSMGGSGTDPAKAPEAEQDRVAGILYGQRGAASWPICGR